jgi:hypothetical protein
LGIAINLVEKMENATQLILVEKMDCGMNIELQVGQVGKFGSLMK